MASPTDRSALLDPLGVRDRPPAATALIVDDHATTYGELGTLVERQVAELSALPAGVAMVGMAPTVDAITAYLACLAAGRPVVLVDTDPGDVLPATLVERYGVTVSRGVSRLAPSGTWTVTAEATGIDGLPAMVLLTTSGSTGNPKLVRLSHRAIRANAASIVASLGIGSDERAPTSLPLFYSYGLSVLNSHLSAGATVVLTGDGVMTREFWTTFDAAACSSFAGVPYTYSMLKRLRFDPAAHPSLRTMTQAGGKLDLELRRHFHGTMSSIGGRFVVMYGQTEGTARLSVLPHEDFIGRERSVGRAIPGGRFAVVGEGGETDEHGVEGEVVYYGQNVMDGYAETTADLVLGDQLGGRLLTGDRGVLDPDGVLWLTGRVKRIAKIFGTRVNLDDVEEMLTSFGVVGAAISGDDAVMIAVERSGHDTASLAKDLAQRLRVHRTGVHVHGVDRLPLLPNGKIDYRGLARTIDPSNNP